MKLIKLIVDKTKKTIPNNKRDFRFIPFGFVVIYILLLFFSEFYLGSYVSIGKYFMSLPIPYFIDLKGLLCGVDAIREGVNPYNSICFNGLPYFNYPYTWGVLSFMPFITTSNHIYIGLGLMLGLFIALYFYIGKIALFDAIVYTLLLVSPAIMLGVERGNSDLIIFLILLTPLINKNSTNLFVFVILITSFLKLFPIGATICVLNNTNDKIKKTFWALLSTFFFFSAYLVLVKENIILVSHKTPRPYGFFSYGLGKIPLDIPEILTPVPGILTP